MIAVLQRVSHAQVTVAGECVGAIGPGILALIGAVDGDDGADVDFMARRIPNLRFFADEDGRMNLSVSDIGGAILVVSQFTLAGDTRKGRRPSFVRALAPDLAAPMIEDLAGRFEAAGLEVATGEFGANMQVELLNDGPVTLLLDSRQTRRGNDRDAGGA
ncbi:MAG: D-tyrosyl-tRNA(Tyr) deacylase [Acidobacteria bacterium]|nr:D-tyrosyl-tRNA(Tyr) deacylase [Acidobacteriota bacterium]